MRQLEIASATRERHDPESEIVESGFALRNRRIGDLMLPRAAVAWLDTDHPVGEQGQTIASADQDAFPVCRGGLDHVLRVVGSRQARSAFAADGRLNLTGRLREPLRLPRTMRLLDGMLPIAELRALFGLDSAVGGQDRTYRTLAGLVLARLGRLPAVGDVVEWQGLRIEVVDLDGRRVDKLLATPVA